MLSEVEMAARGRPRFSSDNMPAWEGMEGPGRFGSGSESRSHVENRAAFFTRD